MNDQIIEKLINNIKDSNKNKSSYWHQHLDEKNFYNETTNLNFGSYTKNNFKNNLFNFIRFNLIEKKIYETEIFKQIKSIFQKTDRIIDADVVRHIYTFEKIKKLISPEKICIIGDGKLNGVLTAKLTYPSAKIYSINLSEVLISDYLILKKINLEDVNNSVQLIDNLDLKENDKKLTLIPSNFKNFLLNKKIDLFINIASFQEMTLDEINNYFKIIKNNKSKLYCCNRDYKKLYGGEEIYFKNYPWNGAKKIFWEDCPWYKKYYNLSFPFVHNYPNIKHCLVDFS